MNPVRVPKFPGNLLLIDGISGSGKTLITRLIDGYSANTSPSFNYSLEHLSILHHLRKIDTATAQLLIKLNLDQRRYDHSISREINLRPSDLSSVLKSSKRISYLISLLKSDTELNSGIRMGSQPNLVFVTHQLNSATKIIEDTYTGSFLEILCLRHPYYLLSHWESYVPMIGSNPRDFTVWTEHNDEVIPWFIKKFPDLYLQSDVVNRAAICVIEILSQSLTKLSVNSDNLVVIPFEKFVLNPSPIIARLEQWKSIGDSVLARRILRKEKVPRLHINSGRKLSIYDRYGAGKLITSMDMKADFHFQESLVEQRLTLRVFKEFKSVSDKYLRTFGEWFS